MKSIPGPQIGPRKFHARAAVVRSALQANPEATLQELMKATGVSQSICSRVRARWRARKETT